MTQQADKKPEIWELYQEHDFIDAKDNQGDWRVGYIVDKNPATKIYKVRFDGWHNKYDEIYRFNSHKLQEFRSIVIGYTGQIQNPAMRSAWKFIATDHQQKIAKLKAYIKQPTKWSAHQINQFFRGHNYFYTDFLMTVVYASPQNLASVFQYFKINIAFACEFLRCVDPEFTLLYKGRQNQKYSHLNNSEAAFKNSYFEILDMLYTIIGGYKRFSSFYKDNTEAIKTVLNKFAENANTKRCYQISMIIEFLNQKGFEILNELISSKLPKAKNVTPFLFLKSIAQLYLGLSIGMKKADKEDICRKLISLIQLNFTKLTNQQLKELHKSNVVSLLELIYQLHEGSENEDKVREWTIVKELDLCLLMIKCPFFEKKLKGINGIIELINRQHLTEADCELFKQWINSSKLFEIMFIDCDNAELIKKAAELTRHLDIENILEKEYIYLIWKSRIGKHETALQEIYSLLATIPLRAKYQLLKEQFFEEIIKIPDNEWDEDFIKFVKDYSMNSISWNATKIRHTFGFDILYKNLMDKKNEHAFNSLIELASKMEKTDFIVKFMTLCFKKIAEDLQSGIHVDILVELLKEQLLQVEKNQVNIKETIIKDLLRRQPRTLKQTKNRFEILSQILKVCDESFTFEDFTALWNRFEKDETRKAFYEWICLKKQGNKLQINKSISGENRSRLLLELWPLGQDEKFKQLTEDQATIMIQLFKSANVLERNIVRVGNSFKVESMNLVGFKQIEKAFNEVEDLKVADLLANFISEIYMNPGDSLKERKEDNINSLLDTITGHIRSSFKMKQFWSIKKQLLLTLKVINHDEQIFSISHSPKFSAFKEYTVIHRGKNEEKIIKFNIANMFYEFKKVVAEKFKIPIKNCKLYHKNELVKPQLYFKPIIECHLGNVLELHEVPAGDSIVKKGLIERIQAFFLLLGTVQVQKQAWKIVSQLPQSAKTIKTVQQSKFPWNELTNQSIYLELYMLKVTCIMSNQWWCTFLQFNGISFLKEKMKKVKAKTEIQKQYLMTLTYLIDKGLSIRQPATKVPRDLFLECLSILHLMLKEISNREEKITFREMHIIKTIFSIGQAISQMNLPINSIFQLYKEHLDFLKTGLIIVKDNSARKQILLQLKRVTEIDEEITHQILAVFLEKLFEFVITYEHPQRSLEYFQYTSFVLQKISQTKLQNYLSIQNQNLIPRLVSLMKAEKTEKNIEDVNYLLIGYLKLLKNMVKFSSLEEQENISMFIIKQCLFSDYQAKCKTKESKLASLEVLERVFHQQVILNRDLPFLWELHKNGEWRSRKSEDWIISPTDKMKSSTGYVGIKNLGCICYMISFIQQIFMIPDFRQGILECQDPATNVEEKENLLYQIKKMLFNLSYSEKKFFIPREFCHAFKDYEGNPVNTAQQMDIDEFSGILFDKLETQIKGTKHQNIIKDLFGGVFSNEIICKGCPHFSESEEQFLSVSLTVKSKKDIYQSLDTMIKGDTLDGDNAYFCERCSKKVSAVKRVCLKKLPDYLILALKRFEFDFETMTKLKVNDYCEFPTELNLKPYSQQYLRKQQNSKGFDDEDCQPDAYFEYELKGVVIHLGYADSGHYYSYIEERKPNGKWFQFNDTIVKQFNPKRLAEEAFGGEIGQFQIKEKIKNAYLLIYDRKQKFKKPELTYQNPYQRREYAAIRKNVLQENILQKIESILFSEEYYKFLCNLFSNINKLQKENQEKLLRFAILAYLTIVIRGKEELPAFAFLKKIQTLLVNDAKTIEWVVLIFSETRVLDEFMRNNPIKAIKKLIANWLSTLWPYAKPEIQAMFFHAILQVITVNMENYIQLCQIIDSAICQTSICDYLVKKHIVGRLLENTFNVKKEDRQFLGVEDIPAAKQQNQIGYEVAFERAYSEKKLKIDLDNGYVWSILNRVLQTCNNKGIAYSEYMTEAELKLLQIPIEKIEKILHEAKNKFQIRSFVKYLCGLSYKNQGITQALFGIIQNSIKVYESKRYRQFFILFKHLIRIEDDLLEKRLAAFSKVIRGLKHNEKYSLDSDIIQQWIVKIIKKNKNLQNYLAKENEMLQYLIALSTKKTPSDEIVRKNMSFIEAMSSKLHGVRFYRSKRGYLDNAKRKEALLTCVSQKKEIKHDKWDSDDDLTIEEAKAGETIYYFDPKEALDFIESKVQDEFMGRLTILPKKGKSLVIWKDDQKLTKGYDLADDDILSQENSDKTTETEVDPDQLEELSDI